MCDDDLAGVMKPNPRSSFHLVSVLWLRISEFPNDLMDRPLQRRVWWRSTCMLSVARPVFEEAGTQTLKGIARHRKACTSKNKCSDNPSGRSKKRTERTIWSQRECGCEENKDRRKERQQDHCGWAKAGVEQVTGI
jgi:hypothetical protein